MKAQVLALSSAASPGTLAERWIEGAAPVLESAPWFGVPVLQAAAAA